MTPAPGELETVRRFVNTLDVEAGTDALRTPGDLATWLQQASLAGPDDRADGRQLASAVALREALRAALAANHDGAPPPPAAVDVIDEVAARAELALRLVPDGQWRAQPRATGVDGALGALVALMWTAMSEGTWRRLKVCVHDACQWGFYDQSRARTGKWCSMQICGNRAKQQAWRGRQADAT